MTVLILKGGRRLGPNPSDWWLRHSLVIYFIPSMKIHKAYEWLGRWESRAENKPNRKTNS